MGNLQRPYKEHPISLVSVKTSVTAAMEALIAEQDPAGYWRYDLECYVFVPAFQAMALYYSGEGLEPGIDTKIGNYFRRNQLSTGG